MMLSTALVLVGSSIESFINSAASVECTEQSEPERGGHECQERRRELTSVALGVESQSWLPELRMLSVREMESAVVCPSHTADKQFTVGVC